MTKELASQKINSALSKQCKVRIYFKNRAPIFGTFASLSDFKEMLSKGYVRFVSEANLENFQKLKLSNYTRLFVITDFTYIDEY